MSACNLQLYQDQHSDEFCKEITLVAGRDICRLVGVHRVRLFQTSPV